MARLIGFKLEFDSPLHIGTVRADYDTSATYQHSDTLYAALVAAWCSLGLEDKLGEMWDTEINGQPRDFTLSSLFPFCHTDQRDFYFLPVPLGTVDVADKGFSKKLKKAEYLDLDYFMRIQKYGKLEVPVESIHGSYLTAESTFHGYENFIDRKVYPRARVPRSGQSNETEIYYLERIFFRKGSGLFGLALVENDLVKERLLKLLAFLGDEGIGTDRRVGHGFFKVTEIKDVNWDELLQVNADYRTNLSLFLPESQAQLRAMLGTESRYKLIKRGGWITNDGYLTYRKKSVHMFMEGGLFATADAVAGHSVDLRPTGLPPGKSVDTPIYRTGKSLFLPINLNS